MKMNYCNLRLPVDTAYSLQRALHAAPHFWLHDDSGLDNGGILRIMYSLYYDIADRIKYRATSKK